MNTIHRKYKSTKKEANIIQLKFRLYIQPTQCFFKLFKNRIFDTQAKERKKQSYRSKLRVDGLYGFHMLYANGSRYVGNSFDISEDRDCLFENLFKENG